MVLYFFFIYYGFPVGVKVKQRKEKKKKQKGNLVHAATFSSASVTSIPRVQPCCVATVRCLEREQRCWSRQRRRSFGGCKESRNTKSNEEEEKWARQERPLKLLGGVGGGTTTAETSDSQKTKEPAACEGLSTEISMLKKKQKRCSSTFVIYTA